MNQVSRVSGTCGTDSISPARDNNDVRFMGVWDVLKCRDIVGDDPSTKAQADTKNSPENGTTIADGDRYRAFASPEDVSSLH